VGSGYRPGTAGAAPPGEASSTHRERGVNDNPAPVGLVRRIVSWTYRDPVSGRMAARPGGAGSSTGGTTVRARPANPAGAPIVWVTESPLVVAGDRGDD